jgi:hypothetical protein
MERGCPNVSQMKQALRVTNWDNWWERYVFLLLQEVADELNLFLDNRFVDRPVHNSGESIWKDDEGNEVDYDFVLELDGSVS